MLHRIGERNVPGGGRVPTWLLLKAVKRCCMSGASPSRASQHVSLYSRRPGPRRSWAKTLPRTPCSPHPHHEQQRPSRGHCFHDRHPPWQLPRATIRPHGAQSKVWGSLRAAAGGSGGSGRLVCVIFCLGFFVSSTSSVSLSQT